MSDDAFKNIQVLKGLTVDEFMGTMGLFSAALNVMLRRLSCRRRRFGSASGIRTISHGKKVARRMVTMVNKINKENFGGPQMVTCWTCHRGTTFRQHAADRLDL